MYLEMLFVDYLAEIKMNKHILAISVSTGLVYRLLASFPALSFKIYQITVTDLGSRRHARVVVALNKTAIRRDVIWCTTPNLTVAK